MNTEQRIKTAMKTFNAQTLTELKYIICTKMQELKVKAYNWDSYAAQQLQELNSLLNDIENFEMSKRNTDNQESKQSQPIYAVCGDYDEHTFIVKLTLNLEEARKSKKERREQHPDHDYSFYIIQQNAKEIKYLE